MSYEEWEKANLVIAGLNQEITYEKLKLAANAIAKGAKYIASNNDKCLAFKGKMVIPAASATVAALSAACGKKPEKIIGKPSPYLIKLALEEFDAKPEETAYIGDTLRTDMKAANAAGVYSVLVLTGQTHSDVQPKDLPKSIRPKSTIFTLKDISARW